MKLKVNVVSRDTNNNTLYQSWCEMKYSTLIRFIKKMFNMDEEIKSIRVKNDKLHFYARKRGNIFTFRIYEGNVAHNRITIEL